MNTHASTPAPLRGSPPSRLTTRAFPAYAHRLGVTPHPVTDPRGHSFGIAPVHAVILHSDIATNWPACTPYLWGADLFNHGYWWEAHEAWEEPWKALDRESIEARFLQGLIQVAAAALQHANGQHAGAARLLDRARLSFTPLRTITRDSLIRPAGTAGPPCLTNRFMGLALEPWWTQVERSVAPPPMIVLA